MIETHEPYQQRNIVRVCAVQYFTVPHCTLLLQENTRENGVGAPRSRGLVGERHPHSRSDFCAASKRPAPWPVQLSPGLAGCPSTPHRPDGDDDSRPQVGISGSCIPKSHDDRGTSAQGFVAPGTRRHVKQGCHEAGAHLPTLSSSQSAWHPGRGRRATRHLTLLWVTLRASEQASGRTGPASVSALAPGRLCNSVLNHDHNTGREKKRRKKRKRTGIVLTDLPHNHNVYSTARMYGYVRWYVDMRTAAQRYLFDSHVEV